MNDPRKLPLLFLTLLFFGFIVATLTPHKFRLKLNNELKYIKESSNKLDLHFLKSKPKAKPNPKPVSVASGAKESKINVKKLPSSKVWTFEDEVTNVFSAPKRLSPSLSDPKKKKIVDP